MLLLATLCMTALAETAESERMEVHDPSHPLAFGSRVGAWTGPYTAPALGGHVKVKPHEAFGVEGFWDNTLQMADGIARHDHVLGFSLYTPVLLGDDGWFVSPTVGACFDVRVDTPYVERGPGNTDILIGAHTGGMLEVAVGDGWSVEVNAQAFVYYGNQIATDDWSATASNRLHPTGVFQSIAAINYAL